MHSFDRNPRPHSVPAPGKTWRLGGYHSGVGTRNSDFQVNSVVLLQFSGTGLRNLLIRTWTAGRLEIFSSQKSAETVIWRSNWSNCLSVSCYSARGRVCWNWGRMDRFILSVNIRFFQTWIESPLESCFRSVPAASFDSVFGFGWTAQAEMKFLELFWESVGWRKSIAGSGEQVGGGWFLTKSIIHEHSLRRGCGLDEIDEIVTCTDIVVTFSSTCFIQWLYLHLWIVARIASSQFSKENDQCGWSEMKRLSVRYSYLVIWIITA